MVIWFSTKPSKQSNGRKESSTHGSAIARYPYIKMWTWCQLIQYIKVNLTWLTELNIKAKAIKPPEENTREHHYDLGVAKGFYR